MKTGQNSVDTQSDALTIVDLCNSSFASRGAESRHCDWPTRGSKTRTRRINASADPDRLAHYPFYFAALGEFEFRHGKYDVSQKQFRKALAVARNPMERNFMQKRISPCEHAEALAYRFLQARGMDARPRASTSFGKTYVQHGCCKVLSDHQFDDRLRAGNHSTVILKAQ